MNSIKNLLSKYKVITPPDDAVRSCVVKILKDEINLDINKSEIRVSVGTVFVNADPAYKSEILRLKIRILELLKAEFGPKAPKDIR